MSWSKEWPSQVWPKTKPEDIGKQLRIKVPEDFIISDGPNQHPTHDPYTNPNCFLYYECKCGAKLDPHTKRFSELNNAASKEGWKVRWKLDGSGYEPFCVECGKDAE